MLQGYMRFPLTLLQGYMEHPKKCLDNAIHWVIMSELVGMFGDVDEQNIESLLKQHEQGLFEFKCGWRERPGSGSYMCEIYKNNPDRAGTCFVSISRDVFSIAWNEYDNGKEQSDWERVVFLGYAALKSIDGRSKKVSKANNEMMWARMAGFLSWSECKNGKNVSKRLKRYFTPYYANKIRNALEDKFSHTIKVYANHVRGFYFTTKADVSRDDVTEYAIKAKPSYKKKQRKDRTSQSEERVKKKLGIR